MSTKFEPVIGLEIHVELKTKSKMFCGCKNDPFGAPAPNIYTCPVCLGLPGALPVPNRAAVEWCVMLGQALNCEIPLFTKFDRKNYFYPDLPKGYQISQYDQPMAVNGYLVIPSPATSLRAGSTRNPVGHGENGQDPSTPLRCAQDDSKGKTVRIRRVHMEEDTGKLLHSTIDGKPVTLIDFNRSGVPLVEIVTEPDIRSSEEARTFLKKLHQIIRYLGISEANMEKGSMRLEPNISVREVSSQQSAVSSKISNSKPIAANRQPPTANTELLPAYKVEVKNINSFSFARKAIDYEIARHTELLQKGETPKQETRGWDEKRGVTVGQRSKEEAADYRYFPDPDIPPIVWKKADTQRISTLLPELPDAKKARYIREFGLSDYDATVLTDEKERTEYFEAAVGSEQFAAGNSDIKTIVNWIINKRVDMSNVGPEELLNMIVAQGSRELLSEEELNKIIKNITDNNPKAVADYHSGKEASIMFLIGQVMRGAKGKADAGNVRERLIELLKQ